MEDGVRPDEGTPAPEADPGEAAYRGFLFADLRGYTAYVERHGDSAAADLLDAYRQLVRAAVARHAGAEIRTEGDSFYVVFGSARRAVACGMGIVAAADQASRDHPDRPIRVGIGINAGETVQRGEGFVGTAVNLAARVCAQAREGEVLVTAAVRDAVGSTPDLQLVPKGTRRLKGIARPVPLFAVRRGAPIEPPRLSFLNGRGLLIAAVVLILVPLVAAAAWVAASGGAQRAADSSPGQVASGSATSSVAAIASVSPTVDANAFPNATEADLLEAVGEETARHCERADQDDRPVLIVDADTAAAFGITLEERVAAHIGVACEVPSTAAPDTFRLWVTKQVMDFRSVDVPGTLIINRAGALEIPLGDCSEGGPAYEEWTLGGVGGWFLCREAFGDAVIEWSYEGRPLYGTAIRRDGDLQSLLRWWTAEVRLLAP